MSDDQAEWLSRREIIAEQETGTTFDLSACVREPIHRLGRIQSYGALVAIQDDRIAVTSDNAESLLGVDGLAGAPADRLLTGAQLTRLRTLAGADTGQTAMMPIVLERSGRPFDVTVHASEGFLVLEFERSGNAERDFGAFYAPVRSALTRLQRATTVAAACQAAVREIQALTGYDRVVAYRFESFDGPGEVIAEEVTPDWEPWLGLWFPATDIPPQARRLYENNWIRVIADAGDPTTGLSPALLPGTGEPLDLSVSVLRAVSPFHIEYLHNIGVVSSMSVSLLSDGRLWGLIACHGRAAKELSPQTRAACEFFGVALSLHLSALRDRDETAARESSRTAIARLLERISADLPTGWAKRPAGLDEVIACDAVAVRMNGTVTVHGSAEVKSVLAELPPMTGGQIWHSDRLDDAGTAGALVLSLSGTGDCIAWLRGERTVARRWATDPEAPVVLGPHGKRLTPRGSTAVFLATVRGRSLPWTPVDLAMAAELGRSLVDVALAHTRRLVQLNDELNAFAHVAAHDLKEPLRGIANTATFIAEDASGTLDDATTRRLDTIQRLATRMDELLNALLYYSRLGRTELRRERVRLRDAAARALEVVSPRLTEARVRVELPGDDAVVEADPVLLDEVLVNLLVNAAKYAGDSADRRVAIGVAPSTAPGDHEPRPALFVRDNGVGIPAHLRPEAFELFRRLHPGQEGSGAGLAIVRRIAERHGGQAWAGDSPGGGTTIWATFPPAPLDRQ